MESLRLGEEERLVQGYMEQRVFEPRPFLLYWRAFKKEGSPVLQPVNMPMGSHLAVGTHKHQIQVPFHFMCIATAGVIETPREKRTVSDEGKHG